MPYTKKSNKKGPMIGYKALLQRRQVRRMHID